MLIDGITITVQQVARNARGLSITIDGPSGRTTHRWRSVEELRSFIADQPSDDDMLRALLRQAVNADGSLRAVNFDAMPGKTFELQIRSREVQP